MKGSKFLILGSENDGLSQKKVIVLYFDENASIQTKNCVAASSMSTSIVFGTLVGQVWPPLQYNFASFPNIKRSLQWLTHRMSIVYTNHLLLFLSRVLLTSCDLWAILQAYQLKGQFAQNNL